MPADPFLAIGFDTLDAFVAEAELLPARDADLVRATFVERFVPVDRRAHFSSSNYTTYLWDHINREGLRTIREGAVWNEVQRDQPVFVMWDLHEPSRVAVPGYFQLPIGTVIRAPIGILKRGASFLPEDLYVFDDSYTWCTIRTHEGHGDRVSCGRAEPLMGSGARTVNNSEQPPTRTISTEVIAVECDRCGCRVPHTSSGNRFVCSACGLIREDIRLGNVFDQRSADRLPVRLWYETSCCGGKSLWAVNAEHLDYLEGYVSSLNRKRDFPQPPGARGLSYKLPAWMTSSKNRDEVLRAIDRLRAK